MNRIPRRPKIRTKCRNTIVYQVVFAICWVYIIIMMGADYLEGAPFFRPNTDKDTLSTGIDTLIFESHDAIDDVVNVTTKGGVIDVDDVARVPTKRDTIDDEAKALSKKEYEIDETKKNVTDDVVKVTGRRDGIDDVVKVAAKREYEVNQTGSMINCTSNTEEDFLIDDVHPDAGTFTAYCQKIRYRVPIESFKKAKSIIIGVLSGAGGIGPSRRISIRETWGHNRASVFFLVAGPWANISEEYETHKDLLWIDEEEVYDGERSVLTFKTASFVSIVHILSTQLHKKYGYIFKTDDDSYVDVRKLYKQLYEVAHEPYDYWGWCQRKKFKPLRGTDSKWSVSYETYPEPMYPRYCQGAGFALSRKFVTCMAGEGSLAQARYLPFEDVAMGIQAERCGVVPTMIENQSQFRMYRIFSQEERNKVSLNKSQMDDESLPTADMTDKILQHRINSDHDMREHHKSVLNPNYWKKK